MSKDAEILSKNIARLRSNFGWNQDELAEKAGISREQVSRVENKSNPTLGSIAAIAKALKCSTSDLLTEYGAIRKPTIDEAFEVISNAVEMLKVVPSSVIQELSYVDWENPNVIEGMKIVLQSFSKKAESNKKIG